MGMFSGKIMTLIIAVMLLIISFNAVFFLCRTSETVDRSTLRSNSPGSDFNDGGASNRLEPGIEIWEGSMIIGEDVNYTEKMLQIEPGTSIKVDPDVYINITGRIICEGTEDEPVLFTVNGTVGKWRGINIWKSELNISYFNHTHFSKASVGLRSNRSTIAISNSSFTNCDTDISLEQNSQITALNCSIDKDNIAFIDDQSKVIFSWFLHIRFKGTKDDITEKPISVFNINNVEIHPERQLVSDSAGEVSYIPCRELVLTKRGKTFHTSHKITTPHPLNKESNDFRFVYMNFSKTVEIKPVYYANIPNMITRVDSESLEAFTRDIMNYPDRYYKDDSKEITQYLFMRFSDFFGEGAEQPYSYRVNVSGEEFDITNVEASQSGKNPQKEYLLVAHYDTESPTFKGGDDDASGMAALLECARILSSYEFNHTIRFIAFDGEANGSGNLGSVEYLNATGGSKIEGVISLDRIGYNKDDQNICGAWTDINSQSLVNRLITLNDINNIGLDIKSKVGNASGQDTYESFQAEGKKAIGLSESSEDNVTNWWPDRPLNGAGHLDLDFDYIQKFAELCSAALFDLAEVSDYHPTAPVITSPNSTHLQYPFIEWEESFDFTGGMVDYLISLYDVTEGNASIISNVQISETNYTMEVPLEYGHNYQINISAVSKNGLHSQVNATQILGIVNNPPKFEEMVNQTLYQNDLRSIKLEAEDKDEPPDTLTYSMIEWDTPNSSLARTMLNSSSGELTWSPLNGDVGPHIVTFNVTDGLGGEDTIVININVTNINDAPEINSTYAAMIFGNETIREIRVEEDNSNPPVIIVSNLFRDRDANISHEELDYVYIYNKEIISIGEESNEWYDTKINISAKDEDYFGREDITLTATDTGNSTKIFEFRFNVTPVNDAPRIIELDEIEADEGDLVSFILEYGDEKDYFDVDNPKDDLNVTFSSNKGIWTLGEDNSTWRFSWLTDYFDSGIHTIVINITDGTDFSIYDLIVNITNKLVKPVPFIKIPGKTPPGEYITFDGSKSVDRDGDVRDYRWDFGDGTNISGPDPIVKHKYSKAGKYLVILNVTDDHEQKNETSIVIEVTFPPNTQTVVCSTAVIIALVLAGGFFLSRVGKRELQLRTEAIEKRRSKKMVKKRVEKKTSESTPKPDNKDEK